MTTITNSALAAQVYGATPQPHQRHQTAKPHKAAETQPNETKDQVTLRGAQKTQSSAATETAAPAQNAAPPERSAYKRPGSVIDVKA